MFIPKLATAVFVFLISPHLQCSHAVLQVVPRTRVIEKSIFFTNKYSFNEGILVYVQCDANSKPTVNCKVVQEKYPYKDPAHSCSVTLENNRNKGFLTIFVAALGRDKAVLIWNYKDAPHSTVVTIATINFYTCKINRAKIPHSALSVLLELYFITKFVSYDDDSFDIFYNDPRSLKAIDARLYKMQLDGGGKVKMEPRIVDLERGRYLHVASVASGSPSKGHIYKWKNLTDMSKNPKYHLWLVKPDGRRNLLAQYNGFPRTDVSAGNSFISLCHTEYRTEIITTVEPEIYANIKDEFNVDIEFEPHTTLEPEVITTVKPQIKTGITCTQYNEHGDIVFTTTLDAATHDIDSLTTYNLVDGGMLIMYGARNRYQERRHNKETMFEVVKIDPDGIRVGSLATQRLEIPAGMIRNTYLYKNGNKGFCATVVVANAPTDLSLNKENPVHLTILANCFNEYDFPVWN